MLALLSCVIYYFFSVMFPFLTLLFVIFKWERLDLRRKKKKKQETVGLETGGKSSDNLKTTICFHKLLYLGSDPLLVMQIKIAVSSLSVQ